MITIIHGEDIVNSRNYYTEIRKKANDFHILYGESVSKEKLVQLLEGGMLFNDSLTVCIEDLFSKKKARSKELLEIVSYLEQNNNANIILWDKKELTKAQLNQFKKATVKQFKLPEEVFVFLDNVLQSTPEVRLKLFHKALQHNEAEYLFSMLVRQVRLLLALSDTSAETIEDLKRMLWQKRKLQQQLQKTTLQKLKSLYKKLYEIDVAQKTGNTSLSLVQSLDFLMLEI